MKREAVLVTSRKKPSITIKPPRINPQIFVRLGPILDIIRATIWTGVLANEKPVSIMLIADPESCKTEALKYFVGTRSLEYLSDITSRGVNPYKNDIESGKLRHLVLLDLVRVVSHGKGTSERTIQTLASLMEEGESAVSDAGGRDKWKNFPQIGLMMGITPEYFASRRAHWRKTGFLSRFVPVSYTYSSDTVSAIHNSIARGHSLPIPKPEKLPEFPMLITVPPSAATAINLKAQILSAEMKTYGFRYHKILRRLAQATALINKRQCVAQKDVDQVFEWSKFLAAKAVEI